MCMHHVITRCFGAQLCGLDSLHSINATGTFDKGLANWAPWGHLRGERHTHTHVYTYMHVEQRKVISSAPQG